MKKRVRNIIQKRIVYYSFLVVKPIIDEFPFFFSMIFLMTLSTFINAFYVNGEHLDVMSILKLNKYGAGFPYVYFFPFFVSYILTCFYFLTSKKRWIKYIIYIVLFIIFFINLFILLNFNSILTPWIGTLIMETNGNETSDFIYEYCLSINSIVSYIILLSCVILVVFLEKKKEMFRQILSIKQITFFLFICALYFLSRSIPLTYKFFDVFKCKTTGELEASTNNFKYLSNTISSTVFVICDYFNHKNEYEYILYNTKQSICTNINRNPYKDSLNIILIIGESYNKHHSNLYGYYLPDTPFLKEQYLKGNLFLFSDVIAPYNLTSFSMKNMFSTNGLAYNEQWYSFPLFPAIFKNNGYVVYFWDNQISSIHSDNSDFTLNSIIHNDSISKICYTYSNNIKYNYDEELIRSFENSLPLKGRRNLIILHLMGQHFVAKYRYPNIKSFNRFSYRDIKNKKLTNDQKQQIAEYDNATLYNDYVIGKVIDLFCNTKSVIVYLSDHGEEVFDYRNFIGRSHEQVKTKEVLKYQYEIPFMIWCSDKYINDNPIKIKEIKQSINKSFMTDNVCHILFDLGSINTPYYHKDRDLISPHYKKTIRIVQNTTNYDKVIGGN